MKTLNDDCAVLGADGCPPEAQDAADYITVDEVCRAFCLLLEGVLSRGNEVRYAPHGNVKWAFQLGPNQHPAVRVTREWLAVYLDSNRWDKITSTNDLARRKFDNVGWPL